MATLSQPIKRHGGKSYLAKAIVAMMPLRCRSPNKPDPSDKGWLHYVEPFFGGGAVLFANNPEGISEVVNDLDGELTNFWDVLKAPMWFADLQRVLSATPCSEVEYVRARGVVYDYYPVERAAAFFVRNRQSRQALEKDFATIARNRTRRGMNELPSAWLSAIEGLPEIHARLQRVVIFNSDALKVIKQQDGPRTLFYLDPPYPPDTRFGKGGEYKHEMTIEQHEDLLKLLTIIQGRFILSSYQSDLYDQYAQSHNWACDSIEIDNKASGKKSKDKEQEWIFRNYVC